MQALLSFAGEPRRIAEVLAQRIAEVPAHPIKLCPVVAFVDDNSGHGLHTTLSSAPGCHALGTEDHVSAGHGEHKSMPSPPIAEGSEPDRTPGGSTRARKSSGLELTEKLNPEGLRKVRFDLLDSHGGLY